VQRIAKRCAITICQFRRLITDGIGPLLISFGCVSFASHLLHLFQQLPRFTQQRLNLPSLGDCIPGEQAVPARVLVRLGRAGSLCAAVHAAALLAVHCRRAAGAARTGFGATTRARQHRTGISGVIAHACASRLASVESRPRLEREAFGAFRAADAGLLSDTITRMLRDVADDGLDKLYPVRYIWP
jgi:hypothetical protein